MDVNEKREPYSCQNTAEKKHRQKSVSDSNIAGTLSGCKGLCQKTVAKLQVSRGKSVAA